MVDNKGTEVSLFLLALETSLPWLSHSTGFTLGGQITKPPRQQLCTTAVRPWHIGCTCSQVFKTCWATSKTPTPKWQSHRGISWGGLCSSLVGEGHCFRHSLIWHLLATGLRCVV